MKSAYENYLLQKLTWKLGKVTLFLAFITNYLYDQKFVIHIRFTCEHSIN